MTAILRDLRHGVDRVSFARDVLGFHPDPWQGEFLRSGHGRVLLNCCRQAGKSTTTAVLALHRALYYPASLILLVSPSLRQSSELFKKVREFMAVMDESPPLTEDNRLSCTLANGSRILSLPSSEGTIRGYSSVDLVIEDEAARVPDDLYHSIRPMLAVSGGRLILMSTPFGKRGHFFQEWDQGGDRWQRFRITAADVPRISAEFLAEEKKALPEAWYAQEYEGLFVESLDQVFRYEDVQRALCDDLEPFLTSI